MRSKNQLLSKVLYFLAKPAEYEEEKISASKKIKNILQLAAWSYAIIIPLGILITFLLEYLKYGGINSVDELIQTESILNVIFLAAFLGPVLEESMFRLSLRFNPSYLSLTTFLILKLTASQIPQSLFFNNENFQWIFAAIGAFLVYVFFANPKINKATEKIYKTKYAFIFYLFTITFGYVHLMNYSDVHTLFPAIIILAVPQIIVGAFLGYVRIFYGFQWGILFHGLYNLVIVIPALLYQEENKTIQSLGVIAAIIFLILCIYGIITLITSAIDIIKNRNK